MDKVINGVDVSGCNNIDEWEHCNICQVLIKTIPNRHQCLIEEELRCEFYPNCYYKQLQRLKEENKEKAVITRAYNDLVIENISNIPYAGEIRPDNITPLDVLRNIKKERKAYKLALQEIREIVSKIIDSYIRPYGDYDNLKKILAKINEVIGAE